MILIILIGVPGSGKSTLAKQYVSDELICEADTFPGLYIDGKLQGHLLPQAHEVCQEKVRKVMDAKSNIIFQSNTNLRIDSILPYLILAMKFGYQVRLQLPINDLLHYEHDWNREQQIQIISTLRSSGEKIIPPQILSKLIQSFDTIKPILLPLQEENDPKIMYQYLSRYL